jgi:hypothetical protein
MSTALTEPAYKQDPTGRGTIGLIMSCLVTLSVAVYTAIHLNVVTSCWRRLTKKLSWMLLAMIAPELVIWIAIGQWDVAREICRHLKAIVTLKHPDPNYRILNRNGLQKLAFSRVWVDLISR